MDLAEAARSRAAAEGGLPVAQYNLGLMLAEDQQAGEAWAWLEIAASRGHFEAVAARDADDQQIGVTTGVISRVTGVETGENGLLLSLGSILVPIDKVISVRESTSQSSET